MYQAGRGGDVEGDFYDVFEVAPSRIAAVIGDVTGQGIEASITAFKEPSTCCGCSCASTATPPRRWRS